MFEKRPFESYEELSRRVFEYHAREAPIFIPVVSLCLAGSMWWSPPSVWFVLLMAVGGVCLTISWIELKKGDAESSVFFFFLAFITTMLGLTFDHERNFRLHQLPQALGLYYLPINIYAFVKKKRSAKRLE